MNHDHFSNGWKNSRAFFQALEKMSVRFFGFALLLLLSSILQLPVAAEDLSQYGQEWEGIKQELNDARRAHDAKMQEIKKNNPPGQQRDALLETENANFRAKNQDLGARRDKIHQKVIEEVNKRAAGGQTDASAEMKATKGTKPGDKGFRGTDGGDLDTGSGSRTADKVQDVLDDMGIKVKGQTRGGTVEFGDDFNLTVNKEGRMGRPGSAAHQTQVGVDARNPETFVSEGMGKDQVGRKAVEVQDNIKKARGAYDAPPQEVASNPEMQQKMAKSTKKIMDTQTLSDTEIGDALKQSGSKETVQEFKDRMERIKEGRAKPGDMTPENVESTQKACKKIAENASNKSTTQAQQDMRTQEQKIRDLEAKGDPVSKKQAQQMREELVDSRERINQTKKANTQPVEDMPGETTAKKGPGRTFDKDGKPIESKPTDADGPGGQQKGQTATDPDGPGGTKGGKSGTTQVTDADGPGGTKGGKSGTTQVTDADGPGTGKTQVGDPDGPGATGKGGESLKGKIGKGVSDYMDGAVIIGQTGKIRDGIKESDPKKVLEGLAGEDIADRSDVKGGKQYVDDMDTLLNAKTAEAEAAAVGKLRRMGATDEEIADYKNNYDADPAKARDVVQQVKDRGGKDTAPQKGLDGAGPEESSWNAGDQAVEGVKQAGSYGKTVLDGVSLGGVSRGDQSQSDLDGAVSDADHVQKQTEQQVLSKLYTELRDRGATEEEARNAVSNYLSDPNGVRNLMADLKERDPEAAKGSGRKIGPVAVDNVEIEEDKDGVGQRIVDTFVGAGTAMKETLVDKPVGVVNDTVNDLMDATGIGSAKNDAERNAVEQNELADISNRQIYDRLIRDGATPEQAQKAVDGLARVNSTELRNLQRELKDRNAQKDQQAKDREGKDQKGKDGKTGKDGKEPKEPKDPVKSIFGPREPKTSGRDDFAGGGKDGERSEPEPPQTPEEPAYTGPQNDAGERVDAGRYEQGDRIITQDGTEWVNRDGNWEKTGDMYDSYPPPNDLRDGEGGEWVDYGDDDHGRGGGGGLDGFVERTESGFREGSENGYRHMGLQGEIQVASAAGDKNLRDASGIKNRAGADAGATGDRSSRQTAQGDREDGWGRTLADAVQQGIETGLKQAASSFGQSAADRASGEIFRDNKNSDNGSSGSGDGGSADGGSGSGDAVVQGGGSSGGGGGGQIASGGGGGGGGSGGGKGHKGGKGGRGGKGSAGGTGAGAGGQQAYCPNCGSTDIVWNKVTGPNGQTGTEGRCAKCGSLGRYGTPPAKPPAETGQGATSGGGGGWQCGMCGHNQYSSKKVTANSITYQCAKCGFPSTEAIQAPPKAPPPPPPPPPKKTRQACFCGAPVTYSHDHYLYGSVYKCSAGHAVKGQDLITVEE
jgi:predicted RNA-binding Zn-ribbon protein involved in translation (DUF1610 family)